jgi:hypothetical protein
MINSIIYFPKNQIIEKTIKCFGFNNSLYDTNDTDLLNIFSKLVPKAKNFCESPEEELNFKMEKISKQEIIEILNPFCKEREIELFPIIETPLSYKLSKVTKKELIKCLTKSDSPYPFLWYGELKEFDFIKSYSKLDEYSYNNSNINCYEQYKNNRISNKDSYSSDMFFYDSHLPFQTAEDNYILEFLENVFSPEVRNESGNWKDVLLNINILLVQDGYILTEDGKISGLTKYKCKKIEEAITIPKSVEQIAFSFETKYISHQKELIEGTIDSKPYVSIGKSKELIESALKYILRCENVPYSNSDDLLKLNKKVTKILKIDVQSNPNASENIRGAKQIFSGLCNIAQGMCELRNQNGDGHGYHPNHFIIPPGYARLAASASITYVAFLKETFEEISKK